MVRLILKSSWNISRLSEQNGLPRQQLSTFLAVLLQFRCWLTCSFDGHVPELGPARAALKSRLKSGAFVDPKGQVGSSERAATYKALQAVEKLMTVDHLSPASVDWLRNTLTDYLQKGMDISVHEANMLHQASCSAALSDSGDGGVELQPASSGGYEAAGGRDSRISEWRDGRFQSGYIRRGPRIGDPRSRTERLPPPTTSGKVNRVPHIIEF